MAERSQLAPNALADVVRPVWTEARTREALALTLEALADLATEGGVLRLVTADGHPMYPAWQFERHDGEVRVKRSLLPALRTLRGLDAWAVAVILNTPAPELDDQTPLDWLRAGRRPEAVSELARVVAREWDAGSSDATVIAD